MCATLKEESYEKLQMKNRFETSLQRVIWSENRPALTSTKTSLPTSFILNLKRDQTGNVSIFKARVVADENLQREDFNLGTVYAPAFDFTYMLLTLLVGPSNGRKVQHVDVKAAFLSREIDWEVFVYHPYLRPGDNPRGTVYNHKNALYASLQFPLQWLRTLCDYLTWKENFWYLRSDNNVFVKDGYRGTVKVLAYVDKLVFVGSTSAILNTVISKILHCFEGGAEPLERYLEAHFVAIFDSKFLRNTIFKTLFHNFDWLM